MSLVPAICTQCGAQIKVDTIHEAGICPHCGTAFITEKAINNYNNYTTNNYAGATINVSATLKRNADELYDICLKCCEKNEYAAMHKVYETFKEEYPNDYRVYVIAVLKHSRSFTQTPEDIWKNRDIYGYYSGDCIEQYISDLEKYIAKIKKWGTLCDIDEFIKKCDKHILMHKQSIFKNEEYVPSKNINISLNDLKQFMGDASVFISKETRLIQKGKGESVRVPICKLQKNRDGRVYFEVYDRKFQICNLDISGKIFFLDLNGKFSISEKEDYWVLKKMYLQSINENGTLEIKYEYKVAGNCNVRSDILEKSTCYIATCVYGSYNCPQVWTLRRFRDYTLHETWYGRIFIRCYYTISPTLVNLFGEQKWFRVFWKKLLDNMVSKLNERGIEDTKYSDKY